MSQSTKEKKIKPKREIMLKATTVNSKNKVVVGLCLSGQRIWKKVNLLQEIPFATQQAWCRRQRKGKKVEGQCSMQQRAGPSSRSRAVVSVSSVSLAGPDPASACQCCNGSACTAVWVKTSVSGQRSSEQARLSVLGISWVCLGDEK